MKEIFLTTKDNTKIGINYYENNFKKVVIICPGWFMAKDSAVFLNMSEEFSKFCDVISMDFRGHGKSSGFYTFTAREENDLQAVVEYARTRYKQIILCGFSLGGALVVLHAAKHQDVSKVIAVSAPCDFMKIENHIYSPDAWVPTLFQKFEPKRWLTIRAGNPFLYKDRPIDFVDRITVPTLFLAGEKDPTVFPWHTEALFDKAVCEKQFKLFEKAKHAEDLFIDLKQEFMQICVDWIEG